MNLSRKKPRHFLAAVFGIFAVAIATSGHAQPSIASDVLEIHAALDVMCRGGLGDMRSTEQACDVRLKVDAYSESLAIAMEPKMIWPSRRRSSKRNLA